MRTRMMRKVAAALAVACAVVAADTAVAPALTVYLSEPTVELGSNLDLSTPGIPGVDPIEDYDEDGNSEGVLAQYGGTTINLMDGWGSATVCAVVSAADVRCYGSDLELLESIGGIAAVSDPGGGSGGSAATDGTCTYGWACIWEHAGYTGRRLQFREAGSTQKLADYGFRDQTSSLWNNMIPGKWFDIIDFRKFQPDPYLVYQWGDAGSNLTREPYPGGGNWNDKVDAIRIRQN